MGNVKEMLRKGRELGFELKELKEAKAIALHNAVHIGSGYNPDKVQTSTKNTSESKNIAYSDYSLLLDKKIKELEDYRKQMIDAINTIEETKLRGILIGYYINCKTWPQVAADANYDIRHTLRLHGIALQKVIWI